jgi:hypothetical protein
MNNVHTLPHVLPHVAFALSSKQAHLLATSHTVQFKVNGTDPYGNGYLQNMPIAARIGYVVCVVYCPLPTGTSLTQLVVHTKSCIDCFVSICYIESG